MPPAADSTPPSPVYGGVGDRRPTTATAGVTSLGLSRRQASLLAYSAGWISGLVLLTLESRDREVRRHAAQSFLGFGILTVFGVVLIGLAMFSLFTSLALFRVCLWAAQALIAVGLLLWAWSLVQVVLGKSPRWPLIGDRAERLADG